MSEKLPFGKKPAKIDNRTLKLRLILKAELPALPEAFSVDETLGASFPPDDFGNKEWGDCVIVARAVQTLRMEYFEQGVKLPITKQEVLNEYWTQQNPCLGKLFHPDNGLVMLDSLKRWRVLGWKIAGRVHTIHAFADVNAKDKIDVQRGIYFLSGVQLGAQIPKTALDQFQNNLPWTVTDTNSTIQGGHCIALVAYNAFGVQGVSWGEPVWISWAWLARYADEAYCVVDSANLDLPNSAVDEEKLEALLKLVTGE